MKFLFNAHNMVIAGNSASGKTELAVAYLKKARRALIVDSNVEIATHLGMKYTRQLHNWDPDGVNILYPPAYNVAALEAIIRRARQFRNLVLFIDDLDLYSGGLYWMGYEINTAMINIRHQNIGMILSMKRIVNMPVYIHQQSNMVFLFNVPAQDYDALESWNRSLNYPGDLRDLTHLGQYTAARFEPQDKSIHARDPKKFTGFVKLPESAVMLKTRTPKTQNP